MNSKIYGRQNSPDTCWWLSDILFWEQRLKMASSVCLAFGQLDVPKFTETYYALSVNSKIFRGRNPQTPVFKWRCFETWGKWKAVWHTAILWQEGDNMSMCAWSDWSGRWASAPVRHFIVGPPEIFLAPPLAPLVADTWRRHWQGS